MQRPLCLQCYFRGTETHTNTPGHSQKTTQTHACTNTYSHNATQSATTHIHTHTHTHASPDVVLELSLILTLSFALQPAQSVYPSLDKYTLAGGGVYFTHRVFWFNWVLQRLVAYGLQCSPLWACMGMGTEGPHTLLRRVQYSTQYICVYVYIYIYIYRQGQI